MFNSTISKNISYGSKEPVKEDIENAAKQSQAIEFIEKLPMGFETIVGERGRTLSGGQNGGLAIARALMRADVLIFDEATSSVDNKTEQLIQKALFNIRKGRTTIIAPSIVNCKKL